MTNAELAADELLPFQDFPMETIWISVGTHRCLVGDKVLGSNIKFGGEDPFYDLVVRIERTSFNGVPYPIAGQRVVFQNSVWAVDTVRYDDGESFITINFRSVGERQPDDPLLNADGTWMLSEDGQPLES